MDVAKYLAVLLVLCLEGGETGGGGKHHDHVRLHIPEFHHHDHHKKVITIHHHHHKPKKEHHHHHHHHHKPQIPHGHHYHRHHKKVHTKTHTESKGGKHHGNHHVKHGHTHKHGHHGHGHQSHHGHHAHHGHGHHDAPVIPSFAYSPGASYSPGSVPSYEDDYTPSYSPPAYGGIPATSFSSPQAPRVHGVTHTVKQVKVFDSLPGALPNKGASHGYEVTEEGEEDDDVFTTVNQIQNTFPATYGFVRSAAPQQHNDPYSGIVSHNAVPTHFAAAPVPTTALSGGIEDFSGPNPSDSFAAAPVSSTALSGGIETFSGPDQNDPFASAPVPTTAHAGGLETFSTVQSHPFASSAPTQGLSGVQPSVVYPQNFQENGLEGQLNSFTGSQGTEESFISDDHNILSDETPTSFTREAGIQHTTNTGKIETIVY